MKPSKIILDPEEQEIEDSVDKWVSIPETNPIWKDLQEAAKNHNKSRTLNLRVHAETIDAIKTKAKRAGLPYQTLINSLLHQYATGKISIQL